MRIGKLTLIAFGLTVAMLLLIVLGALLTSGLSLLLSSLPGLGWVDHWMILPALMWGWFLLPDHYKVWHRDYAIHGSILIDAPVSEVWNFVIPRPGKEHFSDAIVRVDAVEGQPDTLDLVHDPKLVGEDIPPLRARIEVNEPYSRFVMSYENADAFPLWAGDLVTSEYHLETENGQTRLYMVENLDKLRVSSVLSLMFLNPCKDALRRVAALIEGRPDPSWMTRMQGEIEPDGTPSGSTTRATTYVGLMVCVMLTVATFGLVYGLMGIMTPG